MYVLYSFGNVVELFLEQTVGNLASLLYLFIYFGGVIAATIPSLIKHKDNYSYNSVGASGAVSAVLFSAIAFMPLEGGIGIIFIPLLLSGLSILFVFI